MTAKVSVIIPAYNAASTLPNCLEALQNEPDQDVEMIVVDDCSTDDTPEIARSMGVKVVRSPARRGPAAARNLGALQAKGEILFFVDADVVIKSGAISIVRRILIKDQSPAAVFGSYDDEPAEKNFLSQYKNLMHHFVHQSSNEDATTFWAGCGAIKKEIFEFLNGFNSQKYPHPSIEDIDLGIRLKQSHHSIRLEKQLQGKHLKKWTILSLLKADIFHRALPWSRLISETGRVPNQLNLQTSHRVSSLLTALFIVTLMAGIFLFSWGILAVSGALLGLIVLLNRDLYSFFLRKRGPLFLAGAIFWHMFYYIYSAIIFVYCWLRYRALNRRDRPSLAAEMNMASHEKRQ